MKKKLKTISNNMLLKILFILMALIIIFTLKENKVLATGGLEKLEITPRSSDIVQDTNNNNIYRVTVNNTVTSVDVTAKAYNSNSKPEITGNNELDIGTNKVTIKIDGEEYIVYVRKSSQPISEQTIIPNVKDETSETNSNVITSTEEINNSEQTVVNNNNELSNFEIENVENALENSNTCLDNNCSTENKNIKLYIILFIILIVILIILVILKKKKSRKSKH